MKKRIWPILLASAMALLILLSLGVWQVQRLQWKQGLIADLDRAMAAEPTSLAEAQGKPFAKVRLSGTFSAQPPLRLLSSHQSGPAWELVQGFVATTGEQLLILRGKQPHSVEVMAAPAGMVEITGHLRAAPSRGRFDVENEIANNRWTWWDVPAMQKQFDLTASQIVALVPGSAGSEGLHVDPPKANLRNNHLGYAITWFGLALVLIVMTGVFIRARMKNP